MVAEGIARQGLEWLFSTPWWAPFGLATALTIFLIWWLMQHDTQMAKAALTQDDAKGPRHTNQSSGDQNINYGTNHGIIGRVNIGRQKLSFDEGTARQVMTQIGSDYIETIMTVGGNADQVVAQEYIKFFRSKGVTIGHTIAVGVKSPPPSQWFEGDAKCLVIAPSA